MKSAEGAHPETRASGRAVDAEERALGEDDGPLRDGVDLHLRAVDLLEPREEARVRRRHERPEVRGVLRGDVVVLAEAQALLESGEDRELAAERVLPEVEPRAFPAIASLSLSL